MLPSPQVSGGCRHFKPDYHQLVQRMPDTIWRWQRVGISITALGYALTTAIVFLDPELRAQETPAVATVSA